ncbi:MAG TPA: conjugal transfer protein TrbL family protein [Solirubrobacteraceae bacterium]|jgi:hypothetical protein|nr:conjugal transfer protein TrbL family protein [Solirubrobacteraceae bacterium]
MPDGEVGAATYGRRVPAAFPLPLPGLPTPIPLPLGPSGGGLGGGPSLFNLGGLVGKAINEWFSALVKDALDPAMVLVGRTLLSAPQIAGDAAVHSYWQASLGVADALLVLVVVAGGVLVMGHETLQSRYALKDVLPRLAVAAIAANLSFVICEQMVNVANALASGLLGGGVSPEQAGHTLETLVLNSIENGGIFLVLIGLVCAVMAVALIVVYLVRAAGIVFLVGAAPVCLLGHGLPQTEGLARLWWRLMFAALGVQVAQALVLAGAVHVFFAQGAHGALGIAASGNLVDLLLALCLLFVLFRIPFWAKDLALSGRHSSAARMVKSYVTFRVIRGALGSVL